jgi:hypothetical protein
MGIELYWDNDERTVMLCEIAGHWTWDELFDTLRKIKQVTDKAEYEIAAILDLTGGASIPGGSLFTPTAFEKAKQMLKMGEGGTGQIVVVGANGMIRAAYHAIYGLSPRILSNIRFADSADQARRLLGRHYQQQAVL